MGAGIAGHLARHGLTVTLVDASLELAERARERLLARTRGHVDAGLLDEAAFERTASIEVAGELGAADLVIEAVPEDLELKQQVLGAIEPGPVIATNTSSLPIGELAASVRRRSASSACTGSTRRSGPGDRGHPGPGHRPRGRRRGDRAAARGGQAAGRGRRPRGLHRQPAAERAPARGARLRRGRPRHARGDRRGRAQHVRLPAAVLRAVRDRRHGRARRLRERLSHARARPRPGVRAAAGAPRAGRAGPARDQVRRGLRGVRRRRRAD